MKIEKEINPFCKKNKKIVKMLKNRDIINTLLCVSYDVQSDKCLYRIDENIDNCPECKCLIGELRRIADCNNIYIQVASESTLEYRHLNEYRPDLIIYIGPIDEIIAAHKLIKKINIYSIAYKGRAADHSDYIKMELRKIIDIFESEI